MVHELHFTVRLVRNEQQLLKAVNLRAEAYGRHLPALKEMLSVPELIDKSQGTLVFLAEDKETLEPLGTLRIQTCHVGTLRIEESLALPAEISNSPRVGVTRLAVTSTRKATLVKLVLFKALVQYCLAQQIDWIVIAARPPIDRTYDQLGFKDVAEPKALYPIKSAENIPHRILIMSVKDRERVSFNQNHRLHDFFFVDYHPDIQIFSSISSMWSTPRIQPKALGLGMGNILDGPVV